MTNNIVQIDLDKLDADIADMQKQLELLVSTRNWAQSFAARTGLRSAIQEAPVKRRGRKPGSKQGNDQVTYTKELSEAGNMPEKKRRGRKPGVKTAIKSKEKSPESGSKLGVSEFIVTFLKANDKIDSNAVIKAYASYIKKTEKQVTGNVANALFRLKTMNRINNEARKDGKKGNVWFVI